MADPLGQIPLPDGLAGVLPRAALMPLIELAQAPPAALLQASSPVAASVIGRDDSGALLLQTALGAIAVKTTLPLPVGAQLDLRFVPGPPPAAQLINIADLSAHPAAPAGAAAMPPDPVDLGTELKATVTAPAAPTAPAPVPALAAPASASAGAAPLAVGSQLVLRLVPLTKTTSIETGILTATVAAEVGDASATVLQTPLGLLTLDRRLAVPADTTLGLVPVAALPPDAADAPAAPGRAWPALTEAFATLDRVAPELAARLRSDLTPRSGAELAGTLLFLLGAMGSGTWPGAKAASALDRAGRSDLRLRLDGDAAELRRLADPPRGDWHVFMLPLFDGTSLSAVQLYLRRNSGGNTRPEDGTRFVLDVEMSRLGALQLDGLVRQRRLDLMLRSQREITPELRQDIARVFHDTTTAAGFAGEISFAATARFPVAPLDALRPPVGIDA
jgi:hypothetical protein